MQADADVPTAWLEDGSHVNDHIILQPITHVVEGEVGDVYLRQSPEFELFQEAQAGLGQALGYAPEKTQAQAQKAVELAATVRDGLNRAQQAINAGQNAAQFFGLQDEEKPLGERFVDTLFALRNARQLVTVEFTGRQLDNMAIVGLSVTRDNEDRAVSFEVTFQQLRFTETQFVEPSDPFPNAAEATDGSTESDRNKGTQGGEDTPTSFAFELLGGFGG